MRCQEQCLLETDEGRQLPREEFQARLRRCRECPHAESEHPLVRTLFLRCQEAARSERKLRAELRKLHNEREELANELDGYEQKISKLEELQRVSSEEIERALDEQVSKVREQEQEIAALSVPIIEVWEGTIVLPVIGALTLTRAHILTSRMLQEVARGKIHTAVLDLTGVADIDGQTADHLAKITSALRLLGAEPILTGITPAVAQALVEFGARLPGVVTLRNAKEALRHSGLVSHQKLPARSEAP